MLNESRLNNNWHSMQVSSQPLFRVASVVQHVQCNRMHTILSVIFSLQEYKNKWGR